LHAITEPDDLQRTAIGIADLTVVDGNLSIARRSTGAIQSYSAFRMLTGFFPSALLQGK